MRSGFFKQRYADLVVLTDSPFVQSWSTALVVALVAAPVVLSPYLLAHMTVILFTLVGALGLTILTGVARRISRWPSAARSPR